MKLKRQQKNQALTYKEKRLNMAYDASKEETKEIGRVKKNDRGEYIIVSLVKNKDTGVESVDARLHYTDDNGEIVPTKKGFRVNAELAGDLQEFFRKIAEEDYK